jgi:hypothetical protein
MTLPIPIVGEINIYAVFKIAHAYGLGSVSPIHSD